MQISANTHQGHSRRHTRLPRHARYKLMVRRYMYCVALGIDANERLARTSLNR